MHDDRSTAPDNAGVRIFPPAVYLAGLVIGYALQWLIPLPIVPEGGATAIRILGAIALIAGVATVLAAVTTFRRAGTPVNPTQTTTTLAFGGPYRFTRNPMYLGLALVLAGCALLGNALWPLIAVVPVIFVIRTQVIAREERYLETKFGREYTDFKARVRRWL